MSHRAFALAFTVLYIAVLVIAVPPHDAITWTGSVLGTVAAFILAYNFSQLAMKYMLLYQSLVAGSK